MTPPNFSIVVPVYNEVDSLRELHRQIGAALPSVGSHEIIYIDDGSSDGSAKVMRELADGDDQIVILTFFNNYGKAAALSAGFSAARGDIIATMDSDLQDNPEEIIPMADMLDDGWDLVSGWKKVRNDPISKRWPS